MAPSLCTDWLLATSCQLHCRVWDVPFPNVCICLVACQLSLLPQSQDLVMNVDAIPCNVIGIMLSGSSMQFSFLSFAYDCGSTVAWQS